uniref:Uncharacterized protein n=1 Tax=Tetranychus urticae TaxID=32264 RepID=T1K226_TETUR
MIDYHSYLEEIQDLIERFNKKRSSRYIVTSNQDFRIINTWLGDPSKLVFLEKLIKVIKR